MFWKNREKIKALEKEVEDLRVENEKIHRILKHVGKEPCFEIVGKSVYKDPEEYGFNGYICECYTRTHTLYFYKDNSEYSVHLKEFDDKCVKFMDCEVKHVAGTYAMLKVTVRELLNSSYHINIHNYGGATINVCRDTYLINFDYIDGKYSMMQTFEDDEKLYREVFCKNCDRNSDKVEEEKDD